ncbi:MAG: AAA family ATPase [Rhodobacter sp.]|nr:AAA family ATPase [Rhodobacter sp.]
MKDEVAGAVFTSYRSPPPLKQEGEREGGILVVSQTKGMGEMVGRAMLAEQDVGVKIDTRQLSQLVRDEALDLGLYSIVVFEAHPGNDLEMKALRELCGLAGSDTRFLAMTAEQVTLAYAKDLMEAGVDEVLPLAAVRPELRHAVELEGEVGRQIDRRGEDHRDGVIVAVSKTRGGIGATSLVLNLAFCLSGAGRRKKGAPQPRVAVVDLDFQNGNLGSSIDIEDKGGYLELLKGKQQPSFDFLRGTMVRYKDHFDVLAAPVDFAPLDSLTPEVMTLLLSELRLAYDYVVLDLPRALVNWIEPLLARADEMLIVTDTSVPSIRQARRLIDLYTQEHVRLPISVVVSMEKQPFSRSESLKEATNFLERPLEHWLPRDDARAKKAADSGQPILEVSRRSPIAKPLSKLAARIEEIQTNGARREA